MPILRFRLRLAQIGKKWEDSGDARRRREIMHNRMRSAAELTVVSHL